MESHPKKCLSLKLGQKKLKFGQKACPDSNPAHPDSNSTHPVSNSSHPDSNSSSQPQTLPLAPSTGSTLSGLCNLGNTCYVNCILQVLRFCPHFCSDITSLSQVLLDHHNIKEDGEPMDIAGSEMSSEKWEYGDGALVIHLSKLWQRMTDKEKQAANKSSAPSATKASKFLAKLKEHQIFDNKLQQDAQELLQFLLTNLHETVQKITPPPPSLSPLRKVSPINDHKQPTDGVLLVSLPLSRKRRLSLVKKESNKNPKRTDRVSASSCSKLTDFYIGEENHSLEKISTSETPSTSIVLKAERKCTDFIRELFQGQIISQTRCYECDNFTRRTEPFLDISLSVSNHDLLGFPSASPIKTEQESSERASCGGTDGFVGPFSLSWAISKFCLREKLCGDNKYYCEECVHLVEAEKTILFGRLPTIMILHLNRFTTHSGHGLIPSGVSVSKISGNIAIPIALSFSPWCTQDCSRKENMYELFGVVIHAGSSCSSGHYTAYVRGKECVSVSTPRVSSWIKDETDWVYFDDENVEIMDQDQLLELLSPLSATTVYILFYTLRE